MLTYATPAAVTVTLSFRIADALSMLMMNSRVSRRYATWSIQGFIIWHSSSTSRSNLPPLSMMNILPFGALV